MKAKAGNGREALSTLSFGNRLWHTPSLTVHRHHLIRGWLGAEANPGTLKLGSVGKLETPHYYLPLFSCTDTASEEQGG